MQYRKYMHIERFGTTVVENIELGVCYIFPKIDGTNSSVFLGNDGELHAGSRTREISIESDNAGFCAYAKSSENLNKLVKENPTLRFFGEFLVPHSLRTYRENTWRKFYVFDVIEEQDNDEFRYLPYDEYKLILEQYDIEYIPPIAVIRNTNYEQLIGQLEKNVFLIEDGKGAGEGIVIKNYEYVNKYGRVTWAKIVSSEFKEKHSKIMCGGKISNGKAMIEETIAEKYVTKALCKKVFAKIENEKGEWRSQFIPMLLNMVYYDVVNEECWNFVKENKNPTINFGTLLALCNAKVKKQLPQLF